MKEKNMDSGLPYILPFKDALCLHGETIDRSHLNKIYAEYDRVDDMIDLKLSTTNSITPEEATTVISLLAEVLRMRADFKKMGS